MKYVATLNGKKYEIEIEKAEEFRPMTREEVASHDDAAPKSIAAPAPKAAPAPTPTPAPAASAPAGGGEDITSPLPGSVFDIKVSAGDAVKFGQVVMVLEAMKMETEIVAPADGTIGSILVKKGDAVETGTVLATLK